MKMKLSIQPAHFLFVTLLCKFVDVLSHRPQHCNIGAPHAAATETRCQPFQKFAHLIRLKDARDVQITHEYSKVVDRLHQPQPLQLEKRFANRSLRNTEFTSKALLAQSFTSPGFAGKNAALDLLANVMSSYTSRHIGYPFSPGNYWPRRNSARPDAQSNLLLSIASQIIIRPDPASAPPLTMQQPGQSLE